MKALQIVPTLSNESSGPSYSVPGLCRGLQDAGAEVELFFTGERPQREFQFAISVSPIASFPTPHLGRSPEMEQKLLDAAGQADVIHNNSFWMFSNVYGHKVIRALKRAGKKAPKFVNAPRGTLAAWSLKHHWLQKKVFGWFFGQYAAMRATDMWHATCEKEYEEIRAAGFKQPVAIVPIGMEVQEISSKFRVQSSKFGVQSSKFGVQSSKFRVQGIEKIGGENRWRGTSHRIVFFGRLHAVKRVDMLLRAWEMVVEKRGGGGEKRCIDRRAMAERKVAEWLEGVDGATFDAALVKLVEEKTATGEYLFEKDDDIEKALSAAKAFFRGYARRIVELSDGRCVYFAPDPRSRLRNASNAICWAEYAFHAVSSGGDKMPGKDYTCRKYNEYKVVNTDLIQPTLEAERCVPVLRKNKPAQDAVKFFGAAHLGGMFDVVVRLDEYGNVNANMTEVTFEASTKRRQKKSPQLVSLTEAIRTVVSHQTATGTYPPNGYSVAFSENADKGDGEVQSSPLSTSTSFLFSRNKSWELIIAGPDGGVRADLEAYVAAHNLPRVKFVGEINGPAKYEFLASADLYVLPSATENFGVTLAEALACGTPSLGSKGTPWKELNEWNCGSWGFDSAEELAVELRKLMALSDEERAAMGERGKELIRTNYSWEGVGRKMKVAYEWLLDPVGVERPEWVRVD